MEEVGVLAHGEGGVGLVDEASGLAADEEGGLDSGEELEDLARDANAGETEGECGHDFFLWFWCCLERKKPRSRISPATGLSGVL